MNKILLEIEPSFNPKNDDVIVWDKCKRMFVVISKKSFMNETNEEIKSLQEQIKKQDKVIENLQGQISLIAETLGGMI